MTDILDDTVAISTEVTPEPSPLGRLLQRLAERTARVAVVGQGYVGLPVAMRAVDISATDRARVNRAIRQRLRERPSEFLWPPRETTPTPAAVQDGH